MSRPIQQYIYTELKKAEEIQHYKSPSFMLMSDDLFRQLTLELQQNPLYNFVHPFTLFGVPVHTIPRDDFKILFIYTEKEKDIQILDAPLYLSYKLEGNPQIKPPKNG